ncbi:MAG: Lrp/AsnC family transcriptional regulator [Nitrososphaeria archaeon]
MDEIDRIIIENLLTNARTSKAILARKLNITEAAIRKRLKKLESSGTIVGYKAIVDYQKAELVASITGVDAEPERLWKVIEHLKALDEVKMIFLTSGDHMMLVEIVVKSMDELKEVHEKIGRYDGVMRICPAILIKGSK